ncbi:hypothetical protein MIND_00600600 [Mycena indigotica]|uniref:SET domain-containing protein n=1 Tax=Mycena indigotica TaxID=2126181 RepID=A0A8H6SRS6_9AGAR|nr:uncharacterized protein MIND_00600600 [Mycena indigotica]KAF7303712.1 hypothetical protein MIND_00600600 [Mycena indigotica]
MGNHERTERSEDERSNNRDDRASNPSYQQKRKQEFSPLQRPRKRRVISDDPLVNEAKTTKQLPTTLTSQPRAGLQRVKRTRQEKDRQKTGLSDSEEDTFHDEAVQSISAPVPQRNISFTRAALASRFSTSITAPVKTPAIIEIPDSDDESPVPGKEIIVISDSEEDGPILNEKPPIVHSGDVTPPPTPPRTTVDRISPPLVFMPNGLLPTSPFSVPIPPSPISPLGTLPLLDLKTRISSRQSTSEHPDAEVSSLVPSVDIVGENATLPLQRRAESLDNQDAEFNAVVDLTLDNTPPPQSPIQTELPQSNDAILQQIANKMRRMQNKGKVSIAAQSQRQEQNPIDPPPASAIETPDSSNSPQLADADAGLTHTDTSQEQHAVLDATTRLEMYQQKIIPLHSEVVKDVILIFPPGADIDELVPLVPPSPGRRSYDDTEPYYLEYLDDRPLVVHSPALPDRPLVSGDPELTVLQSSVDEDMSSNSSNEIDALLEFDLDDSSVRSGSPFSFRRPSSRSSTQSEDVPHLDDEEESDQLDLIPHKGRPPPISPTPDSSSSSDADESRHDSRPTSYPSLSWKSYRHNFHHPTYYAKDLESTMHDHINSYQQSFRDSPDTRKLLEAVIRENTSEDEPVAPPIRIENMVDSDPTPPWEFYYTNRLWLGSDIEASDMSTLRQNEYTQEYWPGFQYDTKGRIRNQGIPIFECNAHCSCDDEECRNRVVQKGRQCDVVLRKTEKKGWGVFAKSKILEGTFIGIYSGEFILERECERRGMVYDMSNRTYLLDIDFYNVTRKFGDNVEFGVDAYHVGNFTRFLNHSCDPNCRVCPCYIDEPDERRPLIVFFATRDIATDEELCFSYSGKLPGDEDDELKGNDDDYKPDTDEDGPSHKQSNACYCGASNCTGKMFND